MPNITQQGLSDWSDKDIAELLETGETPDGDTVGGEMAEVVRNTAQLTRGGSRRDGGLHQVAAAGRRAEAAGTEMSSHGVACPASKRGISSRRVWR